MDKDNLIGKRLYCLRYKSYEGEIKTGEEGVKGKLNYIGKIKNVDNESITFEDSGVEVLYRTLGGKTVKEIYFLDLEDFLKK